MLLLKFEMLRASMGPRKRDAQLVLPPGLQLCFMSSLPVRLRPV